VKEDLGINQLIRSGIEDGRKAFCGPHAVQLDLTDRCNNNCIGCWVHSPFIEKKGFFSKKNKELPFALAESLINQLHSLGTKRIIFSGSGEPFLYPRIRDVISLIKSKGMYLNVVTNATLVDGDISKMLVELGVDLITASIWAGGVEAYVATHPGKKRDDFETIKRNLGLIAFYKKRYDSVLPHIKVYNILCSKNFCDIANMINFARDIDADSIEFQAVDTVPGKTDFLALNGEQIKEVFRQIEKLKKAEEMVFYTPEDFQLVRFMERELLDYGKIWKNYRDKFKLSSCVSKIVCRRGYELPVDIHQCPGVNGINNSKVFKYRFLPTDRCASCVHDKDCFKDPEKKYVDVSLLNILGIGTVLRRLADYQENSLYDTKVDSIPCYIGWFYCRILTDGSVIPCCKASEFPLGNIYRNSFDKIWDSYKYGKFRFNAKHLSKKDPYFAKINCLKSCDNWGMNLYVHSNIANMTKKKDSIAIGSKLAEPEGGENIEIMAKDFIKGNFNNTDFKFGRDLVVDGGKRQGYAEYDFDVEKDGEYRLYSRYACKGRRPVKIFVDNALIKSGALARNTGGWTSDYLRWYKEAELGLTQGRHKIRIYSESFIPHIEKLVFSKEDIESYSLKEERRDSYFSAFKKTASSFKDRYLEILGIYDGQKSFKGPFHVQIDLTNNCNNQCIACWCNSPLLKEKRLSGTEKERHLPLGLAKELIDDISRMGATEVYYSGSGEPFMHPQIMEILEYSKKKNLTCHVNTNFTLLTKEKLDRIMDIGVDFLTVSIWAAAPPTYVKTHTKRTEEDFNKLKENLIYLNTFKRDFPHIKLYNVIFNMNYFELEEMVELATETRSESLEFTLVDTIPDATDSLALSKKELDELAESCRKIQSRLDKNNRMKENGIMIYKFDQFLRRISVLDDVREAKYDRNVIDSMPCYIGWLFARVVPNGEVHSCLKAHRIPTGSLYLNRFSEIWDSEKQAYFRKKTLTYKKDDDFFLLIGNDPCTKEAGCYKSCDDIGRNTWMHNKMKMLTLPEKAVLKSIAGISKAARKIKPEKEIHKRYNKDPVIAGILHGRKSFIGPDQVVIDPTNKCNLKCISCWLYSPLLRDNKPSKECLNEEISKDTLIRLIDDLADLGTKRIRFTGGGEPFMHRGLMDVIEHTCRKGLLAALTTNFGLVSEKEIKNLVDAGLDELCVSIWGSCAEIYSRVHPYTHPSYFEKIRENLLCLKKIKKDRPRVTFANVIMNNNIEDFEGMYEFGLEYGADAIYFTIPDVFSGQTDSLLLGGEERKDLFKRAQELQRRAQGDNINLEYFNGFMRRISKPKDEFQKGEYDRSYINKIPCYVGWLFSRILANGNVVPCCRGTKKVMGNINQESFKDIWVSLKYDEFRSKAKFLSKTAPYFKDIECAKECDNLMHNEQMHKIIASLNNGQTK